MLASRSPRRAELLSRLGVAFEVLVPPELENRPASDSPEQAAMQAARAKSKWGANQQPVALVLAADTVVVCESRVLPKPANKNETKEMLACLSGRKHEVITAVSVRCGQDKSVADEAVVRSHVCFAPLSPSMIEAYVATGEPMDKAGAYAIQGQGACLVTRVEGCYYNVVGLPLQCVCSILLKYGLEVPERAAPLERE